MAGFLDPHSSFHGGVKIGLAHELEADDYYRAKLAQTQAKAKAKAKSKGKAKTKAESGARDKGKAIAKRAVKTMSQAEQPWQTQLATQPLKQAVSPVDKSEASESLNVGAKEADHQLLSEQSALASAAPCNPVLEESGFTQENAATAIVASETGAEERHRNLRKPLEKVLCVGVCPRGGCPMVWTRHAKYLDYSCAACRSSCRGARWHCAVHAEDFCAGCRAAPPEAAFSGGGGDIVDDSWRQRPASQESSNDLLGAMLAAQEHVIQRRRLDDMEAEELRETLRSSREASRRCYGSRPAASDAAGTSPPGHDRYSGDSTACDQPEIAEGSSPAGTAGLMDEDAARVRPRWAKEGHTPLKGDGTGQPLMRTCDLTLILLGDFLDELARGYSQVWFQDVVCQCARDCDYDRDLFLSRLQDIAFEVQRPILENWGFEGNLQGLYDMTSIIREHSGGNGKDAPAWLRERRDHCLTLLYGGELGGMLTGTAADGVVQSA